MASPRPGPYILGRRRDVSLEHFGLRPRLIVASMYVRQSTSTQVEKKQALGSGLGFELGMGMSTG